ncbi:MAG: hypothetical protein U0893_12760 [Chloroflexota bacterium]
MVVAAVCTTTALAQTPEKERRFVYGINLFDGVEYVTGFVPPSVETMYVLAGQLGVIDPKMTQVYFWPITNDYRADFTSLNELVPGQLEIVQGGQVLQTVALTEYVVQVDQTGRLGPGTVFLGEDAPKAWQHFQDERQAYVASLRTYADAQTEYQRQLDEIRQSQQANPTLPTAPVEPAAFSLFSTEVGRGFPFQLPPGEYTIRVRDAAGQVVADSEKRLVAFAPRRTGIGYEILPQERWTVPEQAGDPADVVYTTAGGVSYLHAYTAQELNAEAYARLRNPQDVAATPNRWQWVRIGPLPTGQGSTPTLEVRDGSREQHLGVEDFAVEQVPGAALGYRVVPFAERADPRQQRSPDITGYRVEAPAGRATLRMRLIDANRQELPGSAREVVVVAHVPFWQLALPVIVPLAIGLSVVLWRREQVQSARSLSVEQRRRMA